MLKKEILGVETGTVSHDAEPHPETNEIRQSNFMAGKNVYFCYVVNDVCLAGVFLVY